MPMGAEAYFDIGNGNRAAAQHCAWVRARYLAFALDRRAGHGRVMQGVIEIPVWLAVCGGIAAVIAILDRVLAPSVRWYLRRRLNKAVEGLNERLSLRIQPFKLMRRNALIERLCHDPEVMRAVEAEMEQTGIPRGIILKQVRRYAQAITPSFSAMTYFSVAATVSSWLERPAYPVRLGSLARE